MVHRYLGELPREPQAAQWGAAIPRLSEQWYCCAEPTQSQLLGF